MTGQNNNGAAPLLSVRDLKKHFSIRKGLLLGREVGRVRAVDGVSFDLKVGETLGLVGESGCGKTTAGRALLRLIEPDSGGIYFEGRDVMAASKSELRDLRKNMQIIFQDPYSSLNPRMTVEKIVGEGLKIHGLAKGGDLKARVARLLDRVGLTRAQATRYPHEFSGGQRQRIGIARALALNPKFIVCDEAVSALDVSIQAQIINLLIELQWEFGIAYLFVSHDLSVVEHVSDRVAVMYLGEIVETAASEDLYKNPKHPYTQALLSAVPVPDPDGKRTRLILEGDLPSPAQPPQGCRFHTRCPQAKEICKSLRPGKSTVSPGHDVYCHLYGGDEGFAKANHL